ncbi:WSC-domain-containing protein [Aspergillus costaricaensis CBS 115574]|uniref:WSC-domain-containing protein n=1 Tax=Aspergillus costaricaensis CBS 115574 TaxID=1448317 RepID=A0ACD1HYK3_9EURO|nr:WSC-domain-containing protein [Aspergillus costaricaensis CBS 115574]RAK83132.1 WSC-domain-containing protein [Aspergillus costaricaensis CBS 115574]
MVGFYMPNSTRALRPNFKQTSPRLVGLLRSGQAVDTSGFKASAVTFILLLLGNTHELFFMLPTMKVTSLSAILALSLSAHALSNGFVGCYSSSGSLVNKGSSQFQSTGLCTSTCGRNGARYAATTNSVDCYCGSSLPPSAKLVSQSECNVNCPGFPEDHCGGNGFWSVHQTYITGDAVDGGDNNNNNNNNNNTDDGDGDSDSGDNSGSGPDDGPGSGLGDGPDNGPGKGPGGGPETTMASSFTVYPTPSAVITVTAVTGTSSPSATLPSKESSSVSVATVSPTTATSGASRRFRFLFF